MKGWTPLWSTIIDSSVWGESKDVKILWITMLAKKDREGIVWGALPGLARAAVLEIKDCEAALKILTSPDPRSTTKAFEGRRVEKVDGGWKVLNHDLYRTAISKEYRLHYQAQKQKEYRARKRGKLLPGEAANERALREGREALDPASFTRNGQ
jgi:hypothetical protein